MKEQKVSLAIRIATWVVFAMVLAMTLPHTARVLLSMQEPGDLGKVSAWGGAVAYEVSVAVFTYARVQWQKRNRVKGLRAYLNWFVAGIFMVLIASATANTWYVMEFKTPLQVYARWPVTEWITVALFGTVLPFVQYVFSEVVVVASDVATVVTEDAKALRAAQRDARRWQQKAEQLQQHVQELEVGLRDAQKSVQVDIAAVAEALHGLTNGASKQEKVLHAVRLFPELAEKRGLLAEIVGASPATVSRALKLVETA